MNKPLIVHVRATNFYGGPEKQILEHILRSRDFSHAVVTFMDNDRKNEFLEKCQEMGVPVCAVDAGHPFHPQALFQLRRIMANLNPSIICSHGYRPTILLPIATLGLKIPIVGFARGFTGENSKIAFFERLERLFFTHLTGVICVSHAQKDKLVKAGVRAKNWWVIHNAVSSLASCGEAISCADFRRSLGIPEEGLLVVSAGRLSPEKGHKDLVQAIALLRNQLPPNTCFVFCGDGPCLKSLEQTAKELDISEYVRFVGFRRDILDIFKIMDLLVLPSYTEGLPNVVLESFSCAKPVVATEVGGVSEIIAHGENGLLVRPNNPHELAEAIRDCFNSLEKLSLMGEKGRDLVLLKFSFDEQCHKLETVYKEMLCYSDSPIH